MTDHLIQTINDFATDVAAKEKELADLKRLTNMLCSKAGMPPKYEQISIGEADTPVVSATIAPDRFTGWPLNTAVIDYLKMRKATTPNSAPASIEEIRDALSRGGYLFGTKNKDELLTGLKISLGKSTHTFHKLHNGQYGLVEWYGTQPAKSRRSRKDPGTGDGNGTAGDPAPSDSVPEGTSEASTDPALAPQDSK